MTPEDAREFSESFGMIGAGWWRQVAWADRQGIPQRLGLTTREWVGQYVGGYVKLILEDRREAVLELAAEGMKQREIAGVLGVDVATVNRDIHVADATAEPDPEGANEPEALQMQQEVPIAAAWDALKEAIRLLDQLAHEYDATTIAIAVPVRKRNTTAKKLRSLGTDLGRVAMMIERTGAKP